jgi:1-acyl-sn-glycerol-3-phosphate acyltransferase
MMMFYFFSRWVLKFFLIILFRVKVHGLQNEPALGPVVLCSNHRSLIDPPLVGCFLNRKVHFMAKAELFKIPIFSSFLRNYGVIPVSRGGMNMETIKSAIRTLKQGNMLAIFPEGTRQKGNALGEGKKGAASLVFRSGAKVLPVAIVGDYKLFQPLKVVYGESFDASAFADLPPAEQLDAMTQKIMSSIQALIDQNS